MSKCFCSLSAVESELCGSRTELTQSSRQSKFLTMPWGPEFVPPSLQWLIDLFPDLLLLGHLWVYPLCQAGRECSRGGWAASSELSPTSGTRVLLCCRTWCCAREMENWECTEEIPHTPLHPSSAPTLHTSQDLLIQNEVGGGRIVRGNWRFSSFWAWRCCLWRLRAVSESWGQAAALQSPEASSLAWSYLLQGQGSFHICSTFGDMDFIFHKGSWTAVR